MTDEDFRKQIGENPTDWQLREVYADWLEENFRCLEANGQRWQARNRKKPHGFKTNVSWYDADQSSRTGWDRLTDYIACDLPRPVFLALQGADGCLAKYKEWHGEVATERAEHALAYALEKVGVEAKKPVSLEKALLAACKAIEEELGDLVDVDFDHIPRPTLLPDDRDYCNCLDAIWTKLQELLTKHRSRRQTREQEHPR